MENPTVILITGCSSGIGREAALFLARKGCRVFATVRRPGQAAALRRSARSLPLEVLVLDVDRPAHASKVVASIVRRTGRIDVLINNAGWGAFGALEDFADAEVYAQYETNVFGLLRLTKAVLPAMRSQGSGRILNIGSLAGKMTFAGVALYCSSKHAVEALTEVMRTEVRPFNIQVSVIEPGSTDTQFKHNRHKARTFLEGRSTHQKVLERILAFGNRKSAEAPGPGQVVGTVWKALRARRMAVRYPAGFDARWYPVVRWFLPETLFDLLMRRMYARFEG
jgi:NAD(P)-dependent dehydrogenase (short-subunit alcohol dehydrogenase family)